MIPAIIKKILPRPIKHPILACTQWYWDIRDLPAMSLGDMDIFKTVLASVGDSKVRTFEWGSGASTAYYSKYLRSIGRDFEWHAMENSPEWYKRTQEKLSRSNLTGQVNLYCSEFAGFWELPGFTPTDPVPPQSYTNSDNALKYINMPRELGLQFDAIIVDGRFRRRCLLVAKEVLAPHGVVLLHDAHKTHYHSSLSSYPHVRFIQTGALAGTSQRSTVALGCLDDDSLIRQF